MRALVGSRSRVFWRICAISLALALVATLGVALAGAKDVAAGKMYPTEYAPDAYEYDNTVATAKPIEVNGAPQSRTLSTVSDVDYAKFSADANRVYVIAATDPEINNTTGKSASAEADTTIYPYSGVAAVLELYNSAGEMIYTTRDLWTRMSPPGSAAKADLPTIPDYYSRIVWKAPAAGTYYVRVVPYTVLDERGIGMYNLNVRNVSASVTGRVTYADTGNPAPYTLVQAMPWFAETEGYTSQPGPMMYAITDRNGDYILFDLEQGVDYAVLFQPLYWSDRYQPEFYNNWHMTTEPGEPAKVFLGTADPINGLDAALDLYAPSIQGRLVDEQGKPCAGVGVYANSVTAPGAGAQAISGYAETVSDANGYYYLRNLADGAWTVNFSDDENDGPRRYIPEWWDDSWSSSGADPITVAGGAAEGTYDAVLTEIPVIASGRVTDKAGNPLPNMPVRLYSVAPGADVVAQVPIGDTPWGTAYSNSKGYWEFRDERFVAAGVWTVPLKASVQPLDREPYPAYMGQFYKGHNITDPFDSAAVALAAGQADVFYGSPDAPAKNIDFALDYVTPFVSGRVTDALTGAPLAGVTVWAYRPTVNVLSSPYSYTPFQLAKTDANGDYRFQQLWYGPGIMPIRLGFFDESGMYANEYFDDVQSLGNADELPVGYQTGIVANAALMAKPGRLYGSDRFATASAIAGNRFPGWAGVTNVVVASGDDAAAADPLTAASLCWAYDAPMLLTGKRDANAASALASIKAINTKNGGTTKVYVVGGPNSVPEARIAEFAAVVGAANVERLPYGDRYETARQVALRARKVAEDAGKTLPNFAIIANGADAEKFGDALSASAISGSKGAPILLVTKNGLPPATASALASLTPSAVYVAGGPASVDNAVYGAVTASGRMWGLNRYSTSVAIAQKAYDMAWLDAHKIGVAAKIPDALTGGVDMGASNGPLLVVKGSELPGETKGFITKYKQIINEVLVYGGPNSVSAKVRQQIDAALQ